MSKNSYHVKIPHDLGIRLRTLDHLSRIPQTLQEYGDLIQGYIKKCIEEPRLKAHFQEIYKGKKIFGHVEYETRQKITLPDERKVYVACGSLSRRLFCAN